MAYSCKGLFVFVNDRRKEKDQILKIGVILQLYELFRYIISKGPSVFSMTAGEHPKKSCHIYLSLRKMSLIRYMNSIQQ